ncbi:MAG: hypothetical protein KY475_24935, partial [Planctomycetes bacterium]|nr:hypothetical protein [Planctomycetota bacterium]
LFRSQTERGAVIGGLGGALAGAAIGKHNGETAAGALLGGAVGLIAGSAIGDAKDRDITRQHAAYQYHVQAASRAITPSQVVTMTHSGVNPQVIITQIQQNGVARRLEVNEVIWLHQQGVNESVITAMQHAPLATAVVAPPPAYSPPVVVQEHHYYTPRPRYYHYPRYHHHHHHHRPSFYGGITIGN